MPVAAKDFYHARQGITDQLLLGALAPLVAVHALAEHALLGEKLQALTWLHVQPHPPKESQYTTVVTYLFYIIPK